MIRRVRGRETFRALAGARRHRAGPLAVRVVRRDEAQPPSVAYAVGRAVGGAVVRNRVKRRLREVVRAHADLLEAGGAYLIAAGGGVVSMPAADLDRLVADLLRRAGRP